MNIYESVQAAMGDTFRIIERADSVWVTTHCLYPSSAFVQVVVRGGASTYHVSDDGAGVREIEAAGAEIADPDKLLKHMVMKQGLSIKNGVIRSPACDARALGLAIALVSNASRDVADWLFDHTKIERRRNFKVLLKQFLEQRFVDRVKQEVILGQSNKPHRFEHLIHLANGQRIIVDPVTHDPSSINSRVVANMDIRNAHYENLEQRIVYDDEEDWKPEDLNLLQVGAPIVVPFSKAANVLGRLNA